MPCVVVIVTACSVSNTMVISPSAGAYTLPSAGITANPSPRIFSAKVGSGTSVIGTTFPLHGEWRMLPFSLLLKSPNICQISSPSI